MCTDHSCEGPRRLGAKDQFVGSLAHKVKGKLTLEEDTERALRAVTHLLERSEHLLISSTAFKLFDSALQLTSSFEGHQHAGATHQGQQPLGRAVLQKLHAKIATPPANQPSSHLLNFVQRIGYRSADLHSAQIQLALRTAQALKVEAASNENSTGRGRSPSPSNSSACLRQLLPGAVAVGIAPGENDLRASGWACKQVEAGTTEHPEEAEPPDAADLLLQIAANSQDLLSPSEQRSQLVQLVWGRLLPLMRTLPPSEMDLSPEGWESYFMLEPRALDQLLAGVLEEQMDAMTAVSLNDVIAQKKHAAHALAAVAFSPALHLVARATLHSWLEDSGNILVWELLVLLLRHALLHAHPAEQLRNATHLPPSLAVLYPVGTARALATLLHTAPLAQGSATLSQAVHLLEAATQSACSFRGQQGRPSGAPGQSFDDISGAGDRLGGGHWRRLWEALLDHPCWLYYALQQLPLQDVLSTTELAADCEHPETPDVLGSQDGTGKSLPAATLAATGCGQDTSRGEAAGKLDVLDDAPNGMQWSCEALHADPANSSSASAAAAVYVSWLMWPQHQHKRKALQQALNGQHSRLDLQLVAPWLRILMSWQQHWIGHYQQQVKNECST